MTCYHPLTAYRALTGRNPETGLWPIVFNVKEGYEDMPVNVPCGQCIGCRLEKSRIWAVRCMHEAQMHDKNCFITLTYNDANVPLDKSLHKEHLQKFLKRLRKKYGKDLKYYGCGEYGEVCGTCGQNRNNCVCGLYAPSIGRPHYHLCVFGHDFDDKQLYTVRSGVKLYVSEQLQKLWPVGYSTVGEVTFESAAYVARYVMKKITGDPAEGHYQGKLPEFTQMSRNPGIGKKFLDKYASDIYNFDKVLTRGGIMCKPPRYYDDKFEVDNLEKMEQIRLERRMNRPDYDYTVLARKERVKKLNLKRLKRPLEAQS